ncbi:MAG: hypothetical protein GY835_06465 [bacterium]|nr:hypothetical protein [bacterium]
MSRIAALSRLIEILAELYENKGRSKRVVDAAGMRRRHIEFKDSEIENWHNILVEADKRRRVDSLVETAKGEYPERVADLDGAYKYYLAALKDEPPGVKLAPVHGASRTPLEQPIPNRSDLFPREKHRLLEELGACPCLRDPVKRGRILESLPFRERFAWKGGYDATDSELIEVCSKEPRGFGALVDVLRFYEEPPQRLIAGLCAALDEFWPQNVYWGELVRLKTSLTKIEVSDRAVQALYCEALGTQEPIENWSSNRFLAGLDLLAGKRVKKFLRYLFGGLASAGREPDERTLDVLRDIARAEPGLDLDVLRADLRSLSLPDNAVLQIRAEPDVDTLVSAPESFRLTAKVREAGRAEAVVTLKIGEKEIEEVQIEAGQEADQITEELGNAFREFIAASWDLVASSRICIEMFLPIDLLHQPIESFGIVVGSQQSHPVGRHSSIYARSFERYYHRSYRLTHGYWQEKSDSRPSRDESAGHNHVYWAESDADFKGDLSASRPLFASFLPMGGPGCRRFRTVLDNGFPAVLWLRREQENLASARAMFEELVYRKGFDDLPGHLLEKRCHSRQGEPLWDKVALLWDDPARPPFDLEDDRRFSRNHK